MTPLEVLFILSVACNIAMIIMYLNKDDKALKHLQLIEIKLVELDNENRKLRITNNYLTQVQEKPFCEDHIYQYDPTQSDLYPITDRDLVCKNCGKIKYAADVKRELSKLQTTK